MINTLISKSLNPEGSNYLKESVLNSMPTEVLLNIFENLNEVNLCQLRLVNRRMRNVIDGASELDSKFTTRTASRFTLTFDLEKKAYVMQSLKYGTKPSLKTLTFTQNDIRHGKRFDFVFQFLCISRLQLEGIPNGFLDDNLITYLLSHFISCRSFSISSLTFHRCDMSNFSSSGMRELIKSCSNDLKQFSLTNVENAREDTFTDKHVEAFDLAKLTSLKIAKISMKPGHKYLSITDLFFYQLIAIDAFPALMLQLCLVSTMGLASYLKEWIKVHHTDSFSNITCTLKECPDLSQRALLNECEDLPIHVSNSTDYFISLYIEEHPMNVFCIDFGVDKLEQQDVGFRNNFTSPNYCKLQRFTTKFGHI